MSDEIADLRSRLNDYRLRAKSLYKPIAAAYADAAEKLEAKLIREFGDRRVDKAKAADK
jgi:hypothetical protein